MVFASYSYIYKWLIVWCFKILYGFGTALNTLHMYNATSKMKTDLDYIVHKKKKILVPDIHRSMPKHVSVAITCLKIQR